MLSGQIAEAAAACRALLDRGHDPPWTVPQGSAWGTPCSRKEMCVTRSGSWSGRASQAVVTGAPQAAARAWASYARLALGDLDGAYAAAAEACSAAASADDHLSTSTAMASLAVVSEFRGQLGEALQIIDEAVRLADWSPGRRGHHYPLHGISGMARHGARPARRCQIRAQHRHAYQRGARCPLAAAPFTGVTSDAPRRPRGPPPLISLAAAPATA